MSRQRTQFSEIQTRVLEDTFKECHYPNTDTKKCLALKLDLPENRITVWFQNRRAKQRRHIKKEMGGHSSSRKPSTARPHTISILPHKTESAGGDNENSSYSTWLNNNNSTTNDWKLSNSNAASFGAFNFNNYSGDGNHGFASNFGNYPFQSNETLNGTDQIRGTDFRAPQSVPSFDPTNFIPYSVSTQSYIHPDFISQEAMKMAFHSNPTSHPFFH